MIEELIIDLIALVLVAAGIWLVWPPAGLIFGGFGLAVLSAGLRIRRKQARQDPNRTYRAVEVDES